MKPSKYTNEWSQSAAMTRGSIGTHETKSGKYREGVVSTCYGFVWAYAQDEYATLRFIWNGREHFRVINRPMTTRAVVNASGRFAREIANRKG